MAKQSTQDAFDLIASFMQPLQKTAGNVANEKDVDVEGAGDPGEDVREAGNTVAEGMAVSKAKGNTGKAVAGRGDMAAVKKGFTDRPAVATNDVDAMNDTTASKEAMIMKMARAERLGNTVLGLLGQAAEGAEKEASAEAAVSSLEKEALDKGAEFAYWYARGRAQRMQDEMELKEAAINPALLERVGGIEGLLDKAAAEDPAAVLPPELAGAEAAPEMVEGGEGGEEEALAQIAQVLSEAGITEEELNQMMQQIVAAKQAGMSDEAIMQALSELADEAGPTAGHEAGETAEEEAAEEMAKTAAVSHASQVAMCKALFNR
jgi:hypothetical protein